MGLASACSYGRPEGALGSASELAVGRLTVDQEAALGPKVVRRSGPVGPLLFTNDKEELNALLAVAHEAICRHHHRRRQSLRVRRTTTVEPRPLESGGKIGRNRVKVR